MTVSFTPASLIYGVALLCLWLTSPAYAQEPELPTGLGDRGDMEQPDSSEPALPAGMGGMAAPSDRPQTTETTETTNTPFSKITSLLDVSGFIEIRGGLRLQDDPYEKAASLAESRLQLEAEKQFQHIVAHVTADFLYDPVWNHHAVHLESGHGAIDLRQAELLTRPLDFMDIKLGRQILTWGTGDLVFINDLFPKDWQAFFIGRDEDYLKAPSDALKVSFFTAPLNLDVVYSPRFDSDRFISGRRLSYYNPLTGQLAGRNAPINTQLRDDWFAEDELSLRAYRTFGATEAALYFYDGYWKSPAGRDPLSGLATHPRLRVYGASLRRPLGPGIAHGELGLYDSHDDPQGINPLIRNGEWRLLLGYEQEIRTELTATVQYYLERLTDYDNYRLTLPMGQPAADHNRHVLTLRLTQLLMQQNLTLSLFNFYSPSDRDGYLRLNTQYKLTDAWRIDGGANLFYGKYQYSFFGQFENNNNIYTALRYSF